MNYSSITIFELFHSPVYDSKRFVPSSHISTVANLVQLLGVIRFYISNSSDYSYIDHHSYPDYQLPESKSYQFKDCNASVLFQDDLDSINGSSSRYYYYSEKLNNKNFKEFQSHFNYFDIFDDSFNTSTVTPLIRIGSKGMHVKPHFDAVYNVYLQLYGTKTYKLVAPRYANQLFYHGRYHPHACQSRLNDICTIPRSEYVILQYVLQPGDLLFIPPFWTHETSADTPSVSVSLWWDSKELSFIEDVLSLPLPFESEWSADTMRSGGLFFASLLILTIQKLSNSYVLQKYHSKNSLDDDPEGFEYITNACKFEISDTIHFLRMRYLEDYDNRTICDNQCQTQDRCVEVLNSDSDSNYHNLSTLFLEKDDLPIKWQNKARKRAKLFASVFLQILSVYDNCTDTSNSNNNINGNCNRLDSMQDDIRVTDIDRAQNMCRNRIAVLQMKLCDYIEDMFTNILPQEHSAENIFHLLKFLQIPARS